MRLNGSQLHSIQRKVGPAAYESTILYIIQTFPFDTEIVRACLCVCIFAAMVRKQIFKILLKIQLHAETVKQFN